MGQYYYLVNLDKRQYLHPHKFADGLNLTEFGPSGDGVMFGLAGLLADGNGRGGGDLNSKDPVVGSWAGDRIVIAGDYADMGKFLEAVDPAEFPVESWGKDKINLFGFACKTFEDVSDRVIRAIVASEGEDTKLSKLNLDEKGRRGG